jgi:hypothetical protein
MKKIILSLLSSITFFQAAQAICTYDKVLTAQEFPIGVMLTWSTSFEENTASFIIERSDNGIDFTNIGSTQSIGNSKRVKEYNFLDVVSGGEVVYYRLKQMDVEDSYSYTDILKLKKTTTNNFMVARMTSPNTANQFTATLDVFKEGDLRYEVRDLENNVIFASVAPMQNGLNDITIDLSAAKPNIYRLFLLMDKEEESIVLQKTLDEVEKAKVPVASGQTGTNGKQ